MPKRDGNSGSSIRTIHRACSILRCFTEDNPELGVTTISHKTGIHKSSISRILASLQKEGFVEQNAQNSKYRLGLGLVSLAGLVLERLELRDVVQPSIQELARITQETINISVLKEDESVNIENINSPQPIQHIGLLGRRNPLHCTSTGKIFLAFMTQEERKALLPKKMKAYTDLTITDRGVLETELDRVRDQDYAIAHEEFKEGLSAVAAPIRDHSGQVIATVSISGPTYRMTPDHIETYIPYLLQTSSNISHKLGHAVTQTS